MPPSLRGLQQATKRPEPLVLYRDTHRARRLRTVGQSAWDREFQSAMEEGMTEEAAVEYANDHGLSSFAEVYIKCALWACSDESDRDTGGNPLDQRFDIDDLPAEVISHMVRDCDIFCDQAVKHNIDGAINKRSGEATEGAGRDFWLTRNRHGVGFWDGQWHLPNGVNVAEELTALAQAFKEERLYVGDDGKVHITGC